ncbi:uncharacterized protein LOC135109141 [Scylla paramamosain]|uniref:uncharacterized protein LOC135109141 n=1 Tax=Scylla paramamosain TaxID=85552 RepID=UPI003083E2AE
MKLLILLLASSGIVLASPRRRGPQVVQSGLPHVDQHRYYPRAQLDTRQDSGDPNTVWVKINAKDLPHFEAQQANFLSLSHSSVQNQEPQAQDTSDAQFTVPSSPSKASPPRPQPVPLVRDPQTLPQVTQYSAASQDTGRRKRLQDALVKSTSYKVLRDAGGNAQLFKMQPELRPLHERLADNYTLVIPNPVDNFRCDDKIYGYYADVENDCKIFHVCVPFQQLFPANFTTPYTLQYSFFCNNNTVFSQDTMTCAWEDEALPCEFSQELYKFNHNFFRRVLKEDGPGERWAEVNEPLSEEK